MIFINKMVNIILEHNKLSIHNMIHNTVFIKN